MTYVLHRIREKIGRNGKKNIKPFKKVKKELVYQNAYKQGQTVHNTATEKISTKRKTCKGTQRKTTI